MVDTPIGYMSKAIGSKEVFHRQRGQVGIIDNSRLNNDSCSLEAMRIRTDLIEKKKIFQLLFLEASTKTIETGRNWNCLGNPEINQK